MAERRIGRWLLIALLLPIAGGAIGYWRFKDEDSRLSRLLLAGTFSIPVAVAGGIGALQVWPTNITAAILTAVAAVLVTAVVLHQLFKENPYKELLWACYLCIPGALYLYYGPYKENPRLRRSVKNYLRYTVGLTAITLLLLLSI